MIRKNYHIFAWTNAVIGRVSREDVANAEIIDAAIELFRNGDVAITTNGVTTLSPRVLPFPHDGHGHDDEWVTANFTNATEILAQGYTNWVDAQVGDEEFPSLSLLVEVDETTLHSYFSHDWSGTGGDVVSFTASAFATIVSPRAEPVCNATTNVVEGGEAHEYAVNPCGVGVGRTGHFRVEVAPDSFPDDRIVWEKTGGLEFVGSCTGRCVSVRGVSAGAATLAVKVGVALNLVEPIVVTNIPGAYDALFTVTTNATDMWTREQIVGIDSGTGGLEIYFINSFVDNKNTKAANDGNGIVITSSATRYTLAHEIGHAFGMADIYQTNIDQKEEDDPLVALQSHDKAAWINMSLDWNGGCWGRGDAGTRYYRFGVQMREIVSRMIMMGEVPEEDSRRDITSGNVMGVFYNEDEHGDKTWHKGEAPVGFQWTNRNPTHN